MTIKIIDPTEVCSVCGRRNAYYTRDQNNVCKWCNETKIKCRTCEKTKPIEEYHLINARSLRRQRECKLCVTRRVSQNAARRVPISPENRLQWGQLSTEKGIDFIKSEYKLTQPQARALWRAFVNMDPREQARYLFAQTKEG